MEGDACLLEKGFVLVSCAGHVRFGAYGNLTMTAIRAHRSQYSAIVPSACALHGDVRDSLGCMGRVDMFIE